MTATVDTIGTTSGTASSIKVRENRVRRIAARRGYHLTKSRRRDPEAPDYGLWSLTYDDGTQVHANTWGTDKMENVQLHHLEAYFAGEDVYLDDWH